MWHTNNHFYKWYIDLAGAKGKAPINEKTLEWSNLIRVEPAISWNWKLVSSKF